MLPSTFRFSQSSLQDYVDCPRRFQLRYIEHQAWPGVEAEPFLEHERFLERGSQFHRLVQRHQLGLDGALLERIIADPEMLTWWRAYLNFALLHRLEGARYPEFTLVGELGGYAIGATYDLLVAGDGRLVIFDWKAYRRKPLRQQLAERVQTRLYRYLAVSVGLPLFGLENDTTLVSMIYWVVSDPGVPVVFEYSDEGFAADRAYLLSLLSSFELHEGDWPQVADERYCRFCMFRSFCGRGHVGSLDQHSNLDDNIDWSEFGFDLGGVDEIGF